MRRDLQALEAGYDDEPMRIGPTSRVHPSFAALLGAAALGLAACGGGDDAVATTTNGSGGAPPLGVECGDDPWSCKAGETCWVASDYAWRCQAAGAAAQGDACKAVIGEASCGAGLLCIGADPAKGTCSPFCSATSAAHACPGGAACTTVKFTTPKKTEISASGCAP
jgi:hypothetical protein